MSSVSSKYAFSARPAHTNRLMVHLRKALSGTTSTVLSFTREVGPPTMLPLEWAPLLPNLAEPTRPPWDADAPVPIRSENGAIAPPERDSNPGLTDTLSLGYSYTPKTAGSDPSWDVTFQWGFFLRRPWAIPSLLLNKSPSAGREHSLCARFSLGTLPQSSQTSSQGRTILPISQMGTSEFREANKWLKVTQQWSQI